MKKQIEDKADWKFVCSILDKKAGFCLKIII